MTDKKIFSFDDIVLLSDESLRHVCRQLDMSNIASALTTASEELIEKFMRVLTPKGAAILKEEIASAACGGFISGSVMPFEGKMAVLQCIRYFSPEDNDNASVSFALPDGYRYVTMQDLYDKASGDDGILERRPFVFEDFSRMQPISIRRVLAAVGTKQLRTALHFASDETREQFCSVLPEAKAEKLRKAFLRKSFSTTYSRTECFSAQNRYVWAALMLERQGTVMLPSLE